MCDANLRIHANLRIIRIIRTHSYIGIVLKKIARRRRALLTDPISIHPPNKKSSPLEVRRQSADLSANLTSNGVKRFAILFPSGLHVSLVLQNRRN